MKTLFLNSIIFYFLSVFCLYGQSESKKFRQIGFDEGLSNENVSAIVQDSLGYMWFATEDGLNRYDGYGFKVFESQGKAKNELKSSRIFSLIEDQNHRLWIGTYIGLHRYDPVKDEFKLFQPDTNSLLYSDKNIIFCLFIDSKNVFWVGTGNGLLRFDSKNKVFETIALRSMKKSSSLKISSIVEYQNNIIVATNDGLYKIDSEDHITDLSATEKTNQRNVISLLADDFGKLWAGYFSTGVNVLDESFNIIYRFSHDATNKSSIADNYIYQIKQNKQGEVWLATDNGLSRYLGEGKFDNFRNLPNDDYSISSNVVTDIYFDRDDRMWVATRLGGVCYYDKNLDKFNHIRKITMGAGSLSSNKIAGFAQLSNGQLVIATDGNGINIFNENNQTFDKITVESHGISSNKTLSVCSDGQNGLWIGTWNEGLNHINLKTKKVRIFKNDPLDSASIAGNNIYDIFIDNNGTVWIGTWGSGLSRYNEKAGNFTNYRHDPNDKFSFAGSAINQIVQDDFGNLLIATEFNGLEKFNMASEKFIRTQLPTGSISTNALTSVIIDSHDRIWIGTNGKGLNVIDPQLDTIQIFNKSNGLSNNVVQSILESTNGDIWLSTNRGLSKVDPETFAIKNFTKSEGLQDHQFMPRNAYKLNDGRLAFGGNNGFNLFNPEKLQINNRPPPIYITDIKLFYKPIPIGNDPLAILDKHITYVDELVFKSHQNFLSLEFTALNYDQTQKNQYRYSMEGLHDEWIGINDDRTLAFTALTPGDYTFKVKGCNSDGVCSTKPAVLNITILQPWWKSTWSFVIYVLILIGILYAFRSIVIARTNYINDLRIERLKRDNLIGMNKAKLQFFTNISHEFRTPLTLIMGPLENLLQSGEGSSRFKQQLSLINVNAQRLMRLTNQLLDFRKIETKNLTLQVAEGNIVKFLKEVKLSFEGLASEKEIDFKFQASSNVISLLFDRDQFEKVMFNLLSNAFKNTPVKGHISIEVIENERYVVIKVTDSGVGIETENFEKVFERFYSGASDSVGVGIGLALTKSLVELHHGNIKLDSVVDQYTCFRIELLKGSDHFDPKEIIEGFKDSEHIEHYKSLYPVIEADNELDEDLSNLDKILIVEDNDEVRYFLKSIFRKDYIVLEAPNGEKGFEIAIEEIPDLIISDVMMPILDGIAMCRQLKQHRATSHIPVVLLTARTSLIFKVEGLENGADDYISKPFNPQILSLKVKNLISSRKYSQQYFQSNNHLTVEPKEMSKTSYDEEFIEKALASVEARLSDSDYSVEDLGKDVGLSRMQLYRKLKAITGQSANEFIRNIRLKKAAQLLEGGGVNVSEVTYKVGFSDLQYFRKCFKTQFGKTPSEFIKQSRIS